MNATFTIDTLDGSDLVALAQCMALDATAFPHPSMPAVVAGAPPRIWVARTDRGTVIGFAATMRRGNILEIGGLAVAADHRRAGIGRALVRVVASAARERSLAAVALHVSTANEGAIALYESEGFVAARLLERFYNPRRFGNGGDAFEMVLRLKVSATRWRL